MLESSISVSCLLNRRRFALRCAKIQTNAQHNAVRLTEPIVAPIMTSVDTGLEAEVEGKEADGAEECEFVAERRVPLQEGGSLKTRSCEDENWLFESVNWALSSSTIRYAEDKKPRPRDGSQLG